jgi:hypothetical protein
LTVQQHLIPGQGLLECRTHESISRSRVSKDCEVNVEERQIDNERNHDQSECPCTEMFSEVFLRNLELRYMPRNDIQTHH